METFETILKRVSVRQYDPSRSISKINIEKIVLAGSRAATANNKQPVEFIVVTDMDKRKELVSLAPNNGPYMADSPVVIVVVAKPEKYYLEDGSAASQNVLLMARDLGYGTVWIAGDKKEYAPEIIKCLGVPEEYKLISLICLGYPIGDFPETPKKSIEQSLHWESYKK